MQMHLSIEDEGKKKVGSKEDEELDEPAPK
jgi:hypothetical protein